MDRHSVHFSGQEQGKKSFNAYIKAVISTQRMMNIFLKRTFLRCFLVKPNPKCKGTYFLKLLDPVIKMWISVAAFPHATPGAVYPPGRG